jgi:uncharacterized membrane protein YccC
MTNPLLLFWRVALGAGVGTILGVFIGLSLFGSSTTDGSALLMCIALGSLASGILTWLWEQWKAREASSSSRPSPFISLPPKDDGRQ